MHNITTQVGQIKWSKWATPDERTQKGLRDRVKLAHLYSVSLTQSANTKLRGQ